MLLTIDCGNTNIVFAVYDGETLKGLWRCKTDPARTGDEYLAFISQHFELTRLDLSDISDCIVSSVVPDANFSLMSFAEKGLGIKPLFIGRDIAATDLGLDIRLDKPQEVGADRIVNAIAVNAHYSAPAVVVDFGTATTFDVIGADGSFLGGVISPGINLSISALHAAAAQLPKISVACPPSAIGKNTIGAMQSGVFFGYIGLVEGLLNRIETELGQKPLVLATGGLAPLFKEHIPAISYIDEELTLKGLLCIYQRLKNR